MELSTPTRLVLKVEADRHRHIAKEWCARSRPVQPNLADGKERQGHSEQD
jgi:hypothetical protein